MSQNSQLDSVIEKLERYCNYLQKQLENKKSGRINGIQPDHMAAENTEGCESS